PPFRFSGRASGAGWKKEGGPVGSGIHRGAPGLALARPLEEGRAHPAFPTCVPIKRKGGAGGSRPSCNLIILAIFKYSICLLECISSEAFTLKSNSTELTGFISAVFCGKRLLARLLLKGCSRSASLAASVGVSGTRII